jgi:hypothetical protein
MCAIMKILNTRSFCIDIPPGIMYNYMAIVADISARSAAIAQ